MATRLPPVGHLTVKPRYRGTAVVARGRGAILDRVTGTDQDPTATLDPTATGRAVRDPAPLGGTEPAAATQPDTDGGLQQPASPVRPRIRSRNGWRTRRRLRHWARGPVARFAVPALALACVLAGAAGAGRYLVPAMAPAPLAAKPAAVPSQVEVNSLPSVAPPGADPAAGPQPSDSDRPSSAPTGPTRPQDSLAAWANKLSPTVGVPVIALQAYGYAQLRTQEALPGCHLSWTTLAGIGKIESDHGRAGGAYLLPDGRALPPIIGPALDGTGNRALVKDTDHGLLDGDPIYDRAVGPMQFIPSTWKTWQVDADDDGIADPNDINDAALAAADYLCSGGRDLADGPSWWSAVLSYNEVQAYATAVFNAANDYGARSRTVA
jgi:membrane-bound lytic murein transglycosylase B